MGAFLLCCCLVAQIVFSCFPVYVGMFAMLWGGVLHHAAMQMIKMILARLALSFFDAFTDEQ